MAPAQMGRLDLLALAFREHPYASDLKLAAMSRDQLLAWLKEHGS